MFSDFDHLDELRRHETGSRYYGAGQVAAWAPVPPDGEPWLGRLSAGTTHVFLAGGRPAGFIRYEGDGHVDMLYVDPLHQRRGIGRALHGRAEADARRRGLPRLYTEASEAAREFFAALGYRLVESRTVYPSGVGMVNHRMEKDLRGG